MTRRCLGEPVRIRVAGQVQPDPQAEGDYRAEMKGHDYQESVKVRIGEGDEEERGEQPGRQPPERPDQRMFNRRHRRRVVVSCQSVGPSPDLSVISLDIRCFALVAGSGLPLVFGVSGAIEVPNSCLLERKTRPRRCRYVRL